MLESRSLLSTFTVINFEDAGAGSLRQAIIDANVAPGADTIQFDPGMTTGISLTSGELSITDDLSIVGPGADVMVVSGQLLSRVFSIGSGVTASISGLEIRDGSVGSADSFSSYGGAIRNSGALTVSQSIITHSFASRGGGIYNEGDLTVEFSTVTSNTATITGGGVENYGPGTSTTLIRNSSILINSAQFGGGVGNDNGTVTIANTTIYGNTATGNGGGTVGNTFNLTNVTIVGNSAPFGGGIQGATGLTMNNSLVAKNIATTSGPDVNIVSGTGAGQNNLIGVGTGTVGFANGVNGNQVGTAGTPIDPLLGPLALNLSITKSFALLAGSPAINAGNSGLASGADQRNVARVGTADIGAFEADRNYYVVSNVNNSGAGSFRQAITSSNVAANLVGGTDVIQFNIQGASPYKIQPTSAFPDFTDGILIDASTQSDFGGYPLVEISGESLATEASGLVFDTGSNESSVRGLVINRFTNRSAIVIQANDVEIKGNYLGTNIFGSSTYDGPLPLVDAMTGILVNADRARIGGISALDRNVIATGFNGGDGVQVYGLDSQVIGNYIGLDASGSMPLGNYIGVDHFGTGLLIQGNYFAGHNQQAISLVSSNATILGNIFGLDVSGTVELGNTTVGIGLYSGATATIGDGTAEGRNVITASGYDAISISGSGPGTTIRGNYIGTDLTGTIDIGNGFTSGLGGAGIRLLNSTGIEIGGDDPGQRNVFAANNDAAIVIDGGDSNVIRGNYIGVDSTGLAVFSSFTGNGIGIDITNSYQNIIGGLTIGEGNVIVGSSGEGIRIGESGSYENEVLGNYIGVMPDGVTEGENGLAGISLVAGANQNTIGGDAGTHARNVIGSNGGAGIEIGGVGTDDNAVFGNWIGIVSGSVVLGNSGQGVLVFAGAKSNLIGSETGQNMISGNNGAGVMITGAGTEFNVVAGNYIGTSFGGGLARPNAAGVIIQDSAAGNTIGGLGANMGNLISGNIGAGIEIGGSGTDGNFVRGNLIGTNAAGLSDVPNAVGISISGDAANNTIGGVLLGSRNVISGNSGPGIAIGGAATNSNVVQGNYIGTDISGTVDLGNVAEGVVLYDGATGNTIGGAAALARNVISGNNVGVSIAGPGASNNLVLGNLIGTSAVSAPSGATMWLRGEGDTTDFVGNHDGTFSGTPSLVPGHVGQAFQFDSNDDRLIVPHSTALEPSATGFTVELWAKGIKNQVAGTYDIIDKSHGSAGALGTSTGWVLQGNSTTGQIGWIMGDGTAFQGFTAPVDILDGAYHHLVGTWNAANSTMTLYIDGVSRGTATLTQYASNTQPLNIGFANAPGNGPRNPFKGIVDEVTIYQRSLSLAEITAIYGMGAAGKGGFSALANSSDGVTISGGATSNIIGGANAGERNVISGNVSVGVSISDSGTANNTLLGNYIGVDASGTVAIANEHGVVIEGANGNTIGGVNSTDRNVISGNNQTGVWILNATATGNQLFGNFIGTDSAGNTRIANSYGVVIQDGSNGNLIGGTSAGAGNVISGNLNAGLLVTGVGTDGNLLRGNFIGTNAAGTVGLANGLAGVIVGAGAANNEIGGTVADSRNVISGNTGDGVQIVGAGTSNNTVAGNYIGTNALGNAALTNVGSGVNIASGATNNTIGGSSSVVFATGLISGAGNVISGNSGSGVRVEQSTGNLIQGNFIGTNAQGTSGISNGAVGAWDGVDLMNGASNNTVGGVSSVDVNGNLSGLGNLISGNINSVPGIGAYSVGIFVSDMKSADFSAGSSSNNNVIQGNFIGTNVTGTAALGNVSSGILLYLVNSSLNTVANTIIGGTVAGARNLISGNGFVGIDLYNAGVTGTVIQGNLIGTNAAGTAAIGNTGGGINLTHGVTNTTVGGATTGGRNIISGNGGTGVKITDVGSTGNVVSGNYIGTSVSGLSALGNAGGGVVVSGGATGNEIGRAREIDLFVTSQSTNNFVRVNGLTGALELTGTNGAGGLVNPRGVVIGPDGLVYVASTNTHDAILRFDPVTGAYIDTFVATGSGGLDNPHGLAFGPDGNLYVSSNTGHKILKFNGVTGAYVSDFVANGSGGLTTPRGIEFGPDGDLYVSDVNTVKKYNGSTGAFISTFVSAGSGGLSTTFDLTFGPDGNLYVGSRGTSDSVLRYNGTTGAFIGTFVSTGSGGMDDPFGIKFGPDGNLYVASDPGHSVLRYNGATGAFIDTFVAPSTGGITFASYLAFTNTQQASNVISGNIGSGVTITGTGTSGNTVAANYIGVDATGRGDLGNTGSGVDIYFAATNNTVGGNSAGARNIISGNDGIGVVVAFSGTDGNVVAGNYIGLKIDGATSLPNLIGIDVSSGAHDTRIGTNGDGVSDALERNIISGNVYEGIVVETSTTLRTVIAGNYIGTNAAGISAVGNGNQGISLRFGPQDTRIGTDGSNDAFNANERNVISGNLANGIVVQTPQWDNSVPPLSTNNTWIAGNYIGVNAAGTAVLGNANNGVVVQLGAINTRIGSNLNGVADTQERNVISGNAQSGVLITGTGTIGNTVAGNYIGVDVSGTLDWGNTLDGVTISAGAQGNTIGSTFAGGGNVISGNNSDGIEVNNSNYNTIIGNFIGLNSAGTGAIANTQSGVSLVAGARGNTIGGTTAIARNVLSGNTSRGILMNGAGTTENIVIGNYVGLNAAGNAAVANGNTGILISTGAANNRVGGATAAERNIISGNALAGIAFHRAGATGNVAQGNWIGINAAGNSAVPNQQAGIGFIDGSASNSAIDNVISGNLLNGIVFGKFDSAVGSNNNIVRGNLIGTNPAGTAAIPNTQRGIDIEDGSSGNIIGGTNAVDRNVISGNSGFGIRIAETGTSTNIVQGNYIGVDISGLLALPNTTDGVNISLGASNNTIGGTAAGARNIIGGNAADGIRITGTGTSNNTVVGNYIGATSAVATTVTAGLGSTEGNSQFSPGSLVPYHFQQIISAADFSGPVLITSIRYRPDGVLGVAQTVNYADYRVQLSTTSRATGALSTTYANNTGADVKTVYDAPFAMTTAFTGPAGGPKDFDEILYLTTPFLYDPADGNLLYDIQTTTGPSLFASNIDAQAIPGVWSISGTPGSATASQSFAGIAVIQFGFTPANLGNAEGLRIEAGATNNTIGGTAAGARNIISGNTTSGVLITGSATAGNLVAGNYIGADQTGAVALGNLMGVQIELGAHNNTIGGTSSGSRNVISGNASVGVSVLSDDNTIQGNYIGTDSTGTTGLANASNGIYVQGLRTLIGGTTAGAGNVVSGNGSATSPASNFGIQVTGSSASQTVIQGNFVGSDFTGMNAIPNYAGGIAVVGDGFVTIGGAAPGARNVIAGNTTYGPGIGVYNVNATSDNFIIQGNLIGLGIDGNKSLINYLAGIIVDSSTGILIGGDTLAKRNIISGAAGDAIDIFGGSGHRIQNNIIGLNEAGTSKSYLGGSYNGYRGIYIGGATNITIGGTTAGLGNVISGSDYEGILIENGGSILIAGNLIGVDAAGNGDFGNGLDGIRLDNSPGNTIGGTAAGARNVISGNNAAGINILSGSNATQVYGNLIGTTATGNAALPNLAAGITLQNSVNDTVIGGFTSLAGTGAGNVISGNATAGITFGNGLRTLVRGNVIGLGADGTTVIGNGVGGYGIYGSGLSTIIGGDDDDDGALDGQNRSRNIISGNVLDIGSEATGDVDLTIQGNYIGTDRTGMFARPYPVGNTNGVGFNHTSNVQFGGDTPLAGNVVSGHKLTQISFAGGGQSDWATNNRIQGNIIGLAADGITDITDPFLTLVVLSSGATNNTIGGTTAGSRNIIGGASGILIDGAGTSGNTVVGNYIGTDITGTLARGGGTGVTVSGGAINNTIGGSTAAARNIISGNTAHGVEITSNNLPVQTTHWWKADGTATDSVGSATGTLQNGATYGAGVTTGQAFSLDGVDDYVDLGNSATLDRPGTVTWSMWVNPASLINAPGSFIGRYVLGDYNAGGNYTQASINLTNNFGIDNKFSITQWTTDLTNQSVLGTTVVEANRWYHVAFVRDDATKEIRLYVDGALEGSASYAGKTVVPIQSNKFIGVSHPAISSDYFDGRIDDTAMFDRALTESEIQRIVEIGGGALARNEVQGNYIGTNAAGTADLGNGFDGIRLGSSPGNLIGGIVPGAGNVISGNDNAGIWINGANSTQVFGNLIGVNAVGNEVVGNRYYGILVGANYNQIGGSTTTQRNTVSGTIQTNGGDNVTGSGIALHDGGAGQVTGNIVQGNYIGTDITGSFALANAGTGITVQTSVSGNHNTIGGSHLGEGNVISGNGALGELGAGIYVNSFVSAGVSTPNVVTILGNRIGTNATGSFAVPNRGHGIYFYQSSGNLVGGTSAIVNGVLSGDGNLISGNLQSGIRIDNGGANSNGNVVLGNFIGTDLSGTHAIGNAGFGIEVGSSNSTIGSATTGQGNVISGNGHGVGVGGTSNQVIGNFIGTDAAGLAPLGNRNFGVWVVSNGNTIGGATAAAGNRIANSGLAGLRLEASTSANGTYRNNTYSGNIGLGIDAGAPPIAPNTSPITLNDGDQVAGGVIDYPVITKASIVGANLEIEGFAGDHAIVDIFLSGPSASGFGQGNQFLLTRIEGSVEDTDSGTGNYGPVVNGKTISVGSIFGNKFKFVISTASLPPEVKLGAIVTAVTVGSTSEFGNAMPIGEFVSNLAPVVRLPTSAASPLPGEMLRIGGYFEDLDSTDWTLTVNYGDGTGVQPLSFALDRTFTLEHAYATSGAFTITVTALDNSSQLSVPATLLINVQNERPVATFNEFSLTNSISEGGITTLRGSFTDEGTESHTVTIDWGDNTAPQVLNYGSGVRNFVATHQYRDDGASNSQRDYYRVVVTVTDASLASDRTAEGLFLQEVVNVAPGALLLNVTPSSTTENGTVTLGGNFVDPGVLDTHKVTINWGDGSPEQTTQLPLGARSFAGITHTYRDNASDPLGYVITVTVIDDDEPLAPAIAMSTYLVQNVVPYNLVVVPSATLIEEGDPVSLNVSFSDPGVLDSHEVVINWGDSLEEQVFSLAPGQTSMNGIGHHYANDPDGANPAYTITVKLRDKDMPATSYVVSTASVTVNNIVPSVGSVQLHVRSTTGAWTPVSAGATIREGQEVRITGSFSDQGAFDQHTATVTWAAGKTTSASINSLTKTFEATFTYTDDYAVGTAFDVENIVVSVSDGDGPAGASMPVVLRVENVAPTSLFIPGPANASDLDITLLSRPSDPSAEDFANLTYHWTVSNGAHIEDFATRDLTFNRGLFPGVITVRLTVSDDDGGSDSFVSAMFFGSSSAESILITDAMFPSTITNLTVLSLGGSDVIDARGITNPNLHVILDGGNDADQLFGGAGDDIFILRGGNDVANEAGSTTGQAGADQYFLVPNSVLTIYDNSAQANALNFSLADFAPAGTPNVGVTFDLSLTNTLVPQNVAPTTGATHFVAAQGNFNELVGSRYGDSLTGKSGSTVDGGAGADRLYANTNTTNAKFIGGADADLFTVTGTGISGIDFQGDAGADVFRNESASLSGVIFSGGADADLFTNIGLGSISGVDFRGDQGADVFENFGSLTGAVVFSGGADADLFTNTGSVLGSVDFQGDDGADLFENRGLLSAVIFGGGADADIFTNFSGGTISGIDFQGDAGEDKFYNVGTISGINNRFLGGSDADLFSNTGFITGAVEFSGGADADLFTNAGSITGAVEFNGGADADLFINTGSALGSIDFQGDEGADLFRNEGILGAVEFGGGADADLFVNTAGSTVGSVDFSGDTGADEFTNFGQVLGSIDFNGDTGADEFTNFGQVLGAVNFTGGADADLFVNGTAGRLGEVDFSGDTGADEFTNFGQVLGSIDFNGDTGADEFTNFGQVLGAVNFTGGADADLFVNGTAGRLGEVDFSGDTGADEFTNFGQVVGSIDFNGDAGADEFTNFGQVLGAVNFTGGADADLFVNGTAGRLGEVDFSGDTGADEFTNFGQVVGSIDFNGDAGADEFTNFGQVLGAVNFTGGADADLFVNASGASLGAIDFLGDEGADQLSNFGSVTGIGGIIFTGGADADLFVNTASGISSIDFNGDSSPARFVNGVLIPANVVNPTRQDADVFQNFGNNIGSIDFNGDAGADIFVSLGNNIGSINFEGDEGADVLAVSGVGIGSIEFVNDSEANVDDTQLVKRGDTLINRSTAANASSTLTFRGLGGKDAFKNDGKGWNIIFVGGADADVFQNNADGIGSINFEGDQGADLFENNGNLVSGVIFNGGADADTFVNDGNSVSGVDFNGDFGADLFINTGSGVSEIIFTGGADADVFSNTGNELSVVTFNGGADGAVDKFLNAGSLAHNLTFYGGGGADIFYNAVSATRGDTFTFHGDSGADLFVNYGSELSGVTFNGGADADLFQNSGSEVSGVDFQGDSGADQALNLGAGLRNFHFFGGADADLFENRADGVSGINFQGDGGADIFSQRGNKSGDFHFVGGADADVFVNYGQSIGSIDFQGDAGADRLQNNGDGVGAIRFDGGADADALQNNGDGARNAAGALISTIHFLGDDGADILLNNGSSLGEVNFEGDAGADSFINTGSEIGSIIFSGGADADLFRSQGVEIGGVDFQGDGGDDAMLYNSTGSANSVISFDGGSGVDVFAYRGSAHAVSYRGGLGNDRLIFSGSATTADLNGDEGDDRYEFAGAPKGAVTISETPISNGPDNSRDTLDFSAFTAGAVRVDLASTIAQPQPPLPAASVFSIQFTDAMSVEDVIGTTRGDTIYGNDRDNQLYGAEYFVASPSSPLPASALRTEAQWVYLDFSRNAGSGGEHVYTAAEQLAIRSRMEATYGGIANLFNLQIRTNLSAIPEPVRTAGNYATIRFNETPSYGRPGGESSEVDFGNVNLGGTASVQVNGLLGGIDIPGTPTTDFLESLPEDTAPQIGDDKPVGTSDNFVALSAKIAAHELGHLLGLRHYDSFGPIGFGIHSPPGADIFKPSYQGPAAAFETFEHIIGSPASIGHDPGQ